MNVDFAPSLSLSVVAVLAAALLAVFLLLRWAFGAPTMSAHRWGLAAIRWLLILALLAVLANPVRVDETPGATERPKFLYLLDVSESMGLGDETSRFEEAVRTIEEAENRMPPVQPSRSLPHATGRVVRTT